MEIIIYYDLEMSTPDDICKAVLRMTTEDATLSYSDRGIRIIRFGSSKNVQIRIMPIDDQARGYRCSLSFYPEHLKDHEFFHSLAKCATMSDIIGYYDQGIFEK